jgi:hypothetical protein
MSFYTNRVGSLTDKQDIKWSQSSTDEQITQSLSTRNPAWLMKFLMRGGGTGLVFPERKGAEVPLPTSEFAIGMERN